MVRTDRVTRPESDRYLHALGIVPIINRSRKTCLFLYCLMKAAFSVVKECQGYMQAALVLSRLCPHWLTSAYFTLSFAHCASLRKRREAQSQQQCWDHVEYNFHTPPRRIYFLSENFHPTLLLFSFPPFSFFTLNLIGNTAVEAKLSHKSGISGLKCSEIVGP